MTCYSFFLFQYWYCSEYQYCCLVQTLVSAIRSLIFASQSMISASRIMTCTWDTVLYRQYDIFRIESLCVFSFVFSRFGNDNLRFGI